MNLTKEEIEQERHKLAAELLGTNWQIEYAPGTFGCHELLDRTALMNNLLDDSILSHPACLANPEWYALATQAAAVLAELYQRIGAEHLSETPGA